MKKFKKSTNNYLAYTASSLLFLLGLIPSAHSQATAPIVPENLIAGEGRSITVNISSGTRAALSVGTANSFGVNTNINAMTGIKSSSKASLVPQKGSIFTSLGSSATENAPPTIQADIQNVRTIGGGDTTFGTGAGTTGDISATEDNAQFSEGSTVLTGMNSDFEMDLNPDESSFVSDIVYDGAAVDTVTVTGATMSSANVNSNVNVDISNTSFTSAFSSNF